MQLYLVWWGVVKQTEQHIALWHEHCIFAMRAPRTCVNFLKCCAWQTPVSTVCQHLSRFEHLQQASDRVDDITSRKSEGQMVDVIEYGLNTSGLHFARATSRAGHPRFQCWMSSAYVYYSLSFSHCAASLPPLLVPPTHWFRVVL